MHTHDPIETIIKTRQLGSQFLLDAFLHLDNLSELDCCKAILRSMQEEKSVYPTGWYDPPPGGVSVLFSPPPFIRLQYDTLRVEGNWPTAVDKYSKESVAFVYCSPVDVSTGLFGDIGLTVYSGGDTKVRTHIRECYQAISEVAETAQVGMKMKDLFAIAVKEVFPKYGKHIGWMRTDHDPAQVNLGHTAPGSYSDGPLVGSFKEVCEAIRTRRIYINPVEEFVIPPTIAFTVEARLTDESERMPNTFFHLIVTFSQGEKRVLKNFEKILETVGMDYF